MCKGSAEIPFFDPFLLSDLVVDTCARGEEKRALEDMYHAMYRVVQTIPVNLKYPAWLGSLPLH